MIKIKNATQKGFLEAEEGDGINIASRMEKQRGNVQKGMSQTIKTQCEVAVATQDLRIRKLTPKECLRLMGFEDSDYQALKDGGFSDGAIYHMAGDSIVTTVLCAIFSNLINETDTHKEIIENYTKGLIESV